MRAGLEFPIDFDHANGRRDPVVPFRLPVTMGPFELDRSPNAEFYLADWDLADHEQLENSHPAWEYPVTFLCIEAKISASDPQAEADSTFEHLEWLLRLFQPGDVSVRRHNWMWHDGVNGPQLALFFNFRPVKARPAALYDRPAYPLNDVHLASFTGFFESYWEATCAASDNLMTALRRFGSSYERRDLEDRLIDLVIAMEALFGDGQGSVAYKVAMRGASWLHPRGEGRVKAFREIKKLYDLRSRAVHGGKPKAIQRDQVDELEETVRRSLIKFLDKQVKEGHTPKGSEIDELIMEGAI